MLHRRKLMPTAWSLSAHCWTAGGVMLLAVLVLTAPLSAQTVEAWQRAAVQRHPALAQAGSLLNQKFLALVAEKRKSDPQFFAKPDWPVRAADLADAALRSEEQAAADKMKAGEEARLSRMAPEERDWEKDKARWVFERLVFGDNEDTITSKLNHSKLITSRVSPGIRAELSSRFQWVLGESKFYLDFDTKNGLTAFEFDSLPERNENLSGFVHDDWQRLRTAAIEQFGQPTKSDPFPTDAKVLKTGGWTITDTWTRPNSKIKLGVTEDSGKSSASLRLTDPAHATE